MMNGPSQNSGVLSFGHFIEYLRLKKFNVGLVHYFRVQQVFDKLGQDLLADQPEYLKSLLCPIFATTKEEQRRFSKAFDAYVEYCEKSVGTREPRENAEKQRPDRSKLHSDSARLEAGGPDVTWLQRARRTIDGWRRKLDSRGILAIVLGVATVGTIVGVWMLKPVGGRVENFNAIVTEPSPISSIENTVASPTSLPTPPTPSPSPSQKQRVPPPLFYLALTVVFLLLVLLIAVLRRSLRALDPRSYENKRPPFKWPLRAGAPTLKIYDTEEFRRASRLLRRRQIDEFFRLDIGATVSATIRSLGYPSFQYVSATRVPEYLALIERSSPHDHQAQLFDEMVKALRRDGVVVTRYFYGDDPRVCCDERGRNCTRLELLKQRHAGHRLLLFGTGEQMLDPVTGRLAERMSFLSDWHERAVVTPESNWGWREQVLAEKFVIVGANVEGLVTLVNYFESPAARSSGGWPPADPYPLPTEADNPRAIDAVRDYLGRQTFQWLCACAVYPELHWELTLLLGSLQSMSKGVVKHENLLRLSRLSWFRQGAIPHTVRRYLIAALEPAKRDETRAIVVSLMESNPAPPSDTFASDLYRFELALQRWLLHDGRENLRDLRSALKRLPPRQVSRSEVAVNLLMTVPHRFFGNRLPGMFYRRGLPALGLSTFVNVVIALVLLAAMLVAIRARAEEIPEWAYSPLLAIAPSPSPTPSFTPTPEASPMPTATAIPSPDPSPNATVTVTPVASPTDGASSTPTSSPAPDTRPVSVSVLSECPRGGSFGSDGLQNEAKNRIDQPSNVARLSLDEIGKMKEPLTWAIGQDRSPLNVIGEGAGVQVRAYLLAARGQGPESCNCRLTGPDNTDIHLVLVQSPSADELTSITAEITPRNRPPAWTLPNVRQIAVGKYVRVTGWLFLDTDHVRSNRLKRASNWEIHPVTMFEVCNSSQEECNLGVGWARLEVISSP